MATAEGWATVEEADEYLESKPGTSEWFSSGFDKLSLLTTAYRALRYDPNYLIPTSPTAEQMDRLEQAQIELAWSLYKSPGSSERESLRAQGVQSFTIGRWSESLGQDLKSGKEALGFARYPVQVANLMLPFLVPAGIATITRAQEPIR